MHSIKNDNSKLKFNIQNLKGVALVAVLAVLVVLTILAASFSAMMNLELKQSNEQKKSYQLDMLVDAGLEHSKTLLTLADSNVGQAASLSKNNFSKWLYVKDKTGKVCGRYRIKIEDEAAKMLFTHLSLRAGLKSTIVTTNLSFDRWSEIFCDPVLTAAMVDRLTHKSYMVNMNGSSYRIKETKELAKELAKKLESGENGREKNG